MTLDTLFEAVALYKKMEDNDHAVNRIPIFSEIIKVDGYDYRCDAEIVIQSIKYNTWDVHVDYHYKSESNFSISIKPDDSDDSVKLSVKDFTFSSEYTIEELVDYFERGLDPFKYVKDPAAKRQRDSLYDSKLLNDQGSIARTTSVYSCVFSS